jgi:two-component system, sensor histidine kinase PdtaS
MYEKEQLAKINLKDYLETLMNDILSFSVTRGTIALELDIQVQEIGIKTVVPLALVINELVTNSIKHGVVQGGKIRLHISKTKEGTFRMNYSDSGVWKEPTGSSLGIQLIEIFTEQLDGAYSRVIEPDRTFYQFEFKDLDRVKDKFNFEHSQIV